jgi:hypothetical protein
MNFNFKNMFKKEKSNSWLVVVGVVVLILLSFYFGTLVGYRKASFSYRLGDNYSRVFGFERGRPMMGFGQPDFFNSHGTIGKIVKISLPTIIVADRENVEKVALVDANTIVRSFRNSIKVSDLKTGDLIMIIGDPNNQSQIEAKLIRLMPDMPMMGRFTNATTTVNDR